MYVRLMCYWVEYCHSIDVDRSRAIHVLYHPYLSPFADVDPNKAPNHYLYLEPLNNDQLSEYTIVRYPMRNIISEKTLKPMQKNAAFTNKPVLAMERKEVCSMEPKIKKVVKRKNKLGPKHGAKRNEGRNHKFWFNLCSSYEGILKLKPTLTKKSFLNSNESGPHINGSRSNQVSFGRYFKSYLAGKLKPCDKKRTRKSKYPKLEAKLIQYVELRGRRYQIDKVGMSWSYMQMKLTEWCNIIKDEDYTDFCASPMFIKRCFERHGIVGFNLHGEANECDEEVAKKSGEELRKQLADLIERFDIPRSHIYNADQTGLYYTKLPNRIYGSKADRKTLAGTKQMTSKDRVTLMVACSADGKKVPLFVVGKYQTPACFSLLTKGHKPPLPYYHQKNACEIIDLEIEEAEENLEMKSVSYVSDDDTDEEQSGDISSKQAQETIIPTYLEALNSIQIAVEYAKSKCDAELLQKLESAKYYLQQSKMKEQKSQQVLTAFFKKIT
jgi:Uncharacterized conserved protein